MEELLIQINDRLNRIEKDIKNLMRKGNPEEIIFVKDVAKLIKRSESRVRHLIAAGDIPYHRNERGNITFKRSEIEEWQLGMRIPTNTEIASQAATHIAISKL